MSIFKLWIIRVNIECEVQALELWSSDYVKSTRELLPRALELSSRALGVCISFVLGLELM